MTNWEHENVKVTRQEYNWEWACQYQTYLPKEPLEVLETKRFSWVSAIDSYIRDLLTSSGVFNGMYHECEIMQYYRSRTRKPGFKPNSSHEISQQYPPPIWGILTCEMKVWAISRSRNLDLTKSHSKLVTRLELGLCSPTSNKPDILISFHSIPPLPFIVATYISITEICLCNYF